VGHERNQAEEVIRLSMQKSDLNDDEVATPAPPSAPSLAMFK